LTFIELFILAASLSMDAFAIAVCKGFSLKKAGVRAAAVVGAYFGASQAVMPLIGYLLASRFIVYIRALDHWVAFALLLAIGGKMLFEGIKGEGTDDLDAALSFRVMLPLAVADSIDALAAGVSFAAIDVNIWQVALMIGLTTFAISAAGVYAGARFGSKLGGKAEIAGGLILICFGVKILIEHLFF
jgi:putative Mn2+ efflux pump MntP